MAYRRRRRRTGRFSRRGRRRGRGSRPMRIGYRF